MSTKTVVKIPKSFCREELDARLEKAEADYRKSFNSALRISGPFAIFITLLQEHILSGRIIHPGSPASVLGSEVFCYVSKNEAEMVADLIKIKELTTNQYKDEIENDLQRNINLLAEQLIAQEQKKEQAALEKKAADQKAKALATAVEHFTTKTQ